MKHEEIKSYDFSKDQFKPADALEQVKKHDKHMNDARPRMALAKAIKGTRFWEWVEGQRDGDNNYRLGQLDQVEVNRVKPAMSGYLSALYPRSMEAVFGADPATTGDPEKAGLTMNRWLNGERMRDRILLASEQALMYPGAGGKVGYESGSGTALDRVWMSVFPWWELVLDRDVHDWADQRFIGHVYYRPKDEVEAEYDLDNLSGTSRDDFLSSTSLATGRKQSPKSDTYDQTEGDRKAFVRVLELCNYKDTITVDGDTYIGRLEVYVLDQGDKSKVPVWMGPMSLSKPDGTSLEHIVPLIFDHESEYPLRGIAYVEQLLPQQIELNAYRSHTSSASRRDSRVYLVPKGLLSDTQKTQLTEGEDGVIVEYDKEDFPGLQPDQIVVAVKHAPISTNIKDSANQAERDLERGMTISPAALGIVTKATAQEVRAVEAHTESEFGRHAEQRDNWLAAIIERALRAVIAAMQSREDSEGAYEEQAVSMSADEAIPTEGEVEEPEEEEEEEADEPSEEEEVLIEATEAEEEGEPHPLTEGRPAAENTLELFGPDGELVTVTVADLDSQFKIGFTETGRSPLGDAEMKQSLITLLEPYMQLWEMAKKGNVLAREWMSVMADRFQLPPNLHPDQLEAMERKQGEEKPPEAPPQQGGVDLAAIAQMPPDQALAALAEVFADNPEVMQVIEQASQMPPEQQAEAVQIIMNNLGG